MDASNYTKPARSVPTGQIAWGGRVTLASTAAGAHNLAVIPAGAEVQGFTLFNAALGANCTVSAGLGASTTLFAASVDGNTARTGTFYPITPTVLSANTALVITTGNTGTGLVGGVAVYTMDPAGQA